MTVRRLLLSAVAVALVATALPATASAKRNPYTAGQVCGAGFYKIDRHRLYSGSSNTTLLATTFLLYNGATGRNCAVTMKRRFIGRPTTTGVSLKVKGKRRPWVVDQEAYKYYAGPVYRRAPGRCVRWGATVSTPFGNDSYISPFGHCG
jgi:serine/threonine-protein kinase